MRCFLFYPEKRYTWIGMVLQFGKSENHSCKHKLIDQLLFIWYIYYHRYTFSFWAFSSLSAFSLSPSSCTEFMIIKNLHTIIWNCVNQDGSFFVDLEQSIAPLANLVLPLPLSFVISPASSSGLSRLGISSPVSRR